MLTANSSKNAQGYCQPNKDSVRYTLPLHAHVENHLQHPQFLKLASGTHTEWFLNRKRNFKEIYQKIANSWNNCFNPNFFHSRKFLKKAEKSFQIIKKPTDVTYEHTDLKKKKQ